MSSPLSLFQTLPLLILEKVVEYLAERPRDSFDTDIDKRNECKEVLYPLLSVSERWREAALASLCDNCQIRFDNSPKGLSMTYLALPSGFPFPRHRGQSLVKQVIVNVPSWSDIYSRKFRNISSRSKVDFPVFPSATILMVCVITYGVNSRKPGRRILPASIAPSTNRNKRAVDFSRALRRLVPAATEIVVSFHSLGSTDERNMELCDVLVSELCCGNITRLLVESRSWSSLVSLSLQGLSGLTSITQGPHMACEPFVRIAHHSAGTLKQLSIELESEADWRALIYGDTKTPAVYSSLTSLCMEIDNIPYAESWEAIEDVALFPVLRNLTMWGVYPFDDDSLFRGNGKTLRNLDIPFRALTKNTFGRFGVFERSGVTQMNWIAIGSTRDNDEALKTGLANDSIERQIHRMAEVTTALCLRGDTADDLVYGVILSAPSTTFIQHIEFCSQPLYTSHLLEIISALPSLASLACQIDEPEANIDAISESKLPNALLVKYRHLSNSFKRLVIFDDADEDESDYEYEYKDKDDLARKIAVVAVKIAVLCPNFRHVDLPKAMRNAFSREVAWAMVNRPFLPYANSLRRLLYTN
ncbi:hypothetical protein GGI09_000364 [Coemansia sp. S100]|nr:hypothetical protein LPJ71_000068 [Coemansia sp. S17]KAJ2103981.1 hypothetical protein GGI09_000364 [Coemansia sp. S100]KAJ2110571.1 hypothetical protein GGI16_000241 [Coemansia sp. S142-1]